MVTPGFLGIQGQDSHRVRCKGLVEILASRLGVEMVMVVRGGGGGAWCVVRGA
jgi:hypothetical protein